MILILIYVQFLTFANSLMETHFKQKCRQDNRLLSIEDLRIHQRSVKMCASFCATDETCLSIAFNKVSGVCLIYGQMVDSSCKNTTEEPGFQIYEKVKPSSTDIQYNPCKNNGTWNGQTCACLPTWFGDFCERLPTDCSEVYDGYPDERGGFKVFQIQPMLSVDPFRVKCYMEWGGYTYILDRTHNGTEISFNRNWLDYKLGFGDIQSFSTEFWLGLERTFALTSSRTEQRKFLLDVTIRLENALLKPQFEFYQSYYSDFWIENELNGYRIHLSDYSRNERVAGDSLYISTKPLESIAGQKFSSFDFDNDQSTSNCAEDFQGGWWYNDCTAGCPTCPRVPTVTGYRNKAVPAMFWKYDLDDYALNIIDVKMRVILT